MKFPLTLPLLPVLTTALAPLKALPGLKLGLADLTKARRAFRSLPSGGLGTAPFGTATADPGALTEVAGFEPNPGALGMWRFVPPGLPAGAPLVVVLHGCTQTAAGYDRGSGWSTLAARHGFALLYPEQQRANNHNLCFNWFEPGDTTRGKGEVASIASMVAATVANLRSDPARVFVTGLSAGGAMTAALLATYPDVFAAGAIIAGLPYGSARGMPEALGAMFNPAILEAGERGAAVRAASSSQRRPSVSVWHGAADTTVLPANATETVKQWTDIHGLAGQEPTSGLVDGVPHKAWRDAAGIVRVESYTVPALPHGTPINPAAPDGQGVGTAMPHMLTSRISSTWHIARGWGLLPGTSARA